MKGYAKKNCFELIFLLLQAILYVAFLTLDFTGGSYSLSVNIKYTIIILCFCYALLAGSGYKSIVFCYSGKFRSKIQKAQRVRYTPHERESIVVQTDQSRIYQSSVNLLLQAGLFFTLISDLLILILDYYFYGVLVFILVQQLYSLRLVHLHYERSDKKERRLIYTKRVALQVGMSVVVYLVLLLAGITLDSLLIASVFYFISILINTLVAIRLALIDRKERSLLLYAVGMLLFLLCDINVGLFNMTGFIAMPEEFYSVIYSCSSILMWTFYAPSQVLIAMSGSNIHKKVASK